VSIVMIDDGDKNFFVAVPPLSSKVSSTQGCRVSPPEISVHYIQKNRLSLELRISYPRRKLYWFE